MTISQQLAKQFRDVQYGGNWTWVNLQETLKDVHWQQATTKVKDLNTIALLVHHMDHYVRVVMERMEDKPRTLTHEQSIEEPEINSEADWQSLLDRMWATGDRFAFMIEHFPEEKLWATFMAEQYGNGFRNIAGVIEHNHYHLGQIVVIKKLLAAT
jgi:hypothetical protein